MKIAPIYSPVSTDGRDLSRQADVYQSINAAGRYIAGFYALESDEHQLNTLGLNKQDPGYWIRQTHR